MGRAGGRLGDLEALPFADATFDLVTGFNAFQYAARPVQAVREAARIAKPGGHLAVLTRGAPEGMPAASLVAAFGEPAGYFCPGS